VVAAVVRRGDLSPIHDGGQVLDEVPESLLGGPQLPFDPASLVDLERHDLVRVFQLRGPGQHAELEVVVRGSQSLLRFLLCRDVHHHALPVERAAVLIAQQDCLVTDPNHASVCGDHPVLPRPRTTRGAVQIMGGELDLAVVWV